MPRAEKASSRGKEGEAAPHYALFGVVPPVGARSSVSRGSYFGMFTPAEVVSSRASLGTGTDSEKKEPKLPARSAFRNLQSIGFRDLVTPAGKRRRRF